MRNHELEARYDSPSILGVIKSRRLKWAGHVARMGNDRTAYRVLVGRPEGARPRGRPKQRWEDCITRDLEELGMNEQHWMEQAQERDLWRERVDLMRGQ